MRTVWVIESGDYEQRGVWGVASSAPAAIAFVKSIFGPPYVVEWAEEPEALIGRFDAVAGFSTQHEGRFDFTAYEVQDGGSGT